MVPRGEFARTRAGPHGDVVQDPEHDMTDRNVLGSPEGDRNEHSLLADFGEQNLRGVSHCACDVLPHGRDDIMLWRAPSPCGMRPSGSRRLITSGRSARERR